MVLAFDEFGRPFILPRAAAAAAAAPAPSDPGPSRSFRSDQSGAPCSAKAAAMKLAFDEFGRPCIIRHEQQEKRSSPRGLNAAQKANNAVAEAVALARIIVQASLEPKGYKDKMLQSPDGDVIIKNDGATVLEHMDVNNNLMTAKLIEEMYRGEDIKIVDGDGVDDIGADVDVDGGGAEEAPTVGGDDEAVVATAPE